MMPVAEIIESPANWKRYVSALGPGIAIAATGVGAGDLVAAGVSGSRYGFAVVWAAAAGALVKYALNEGLARWQLATGTTLLEGWVQRLGKWAQYYFIVYLVLWSFIVGGALISACGLAAHAIAPALSVGAWGVIHSLAGASMALLGRYHHFEKLMKWLIAVMFITILGCAIGVQSPAVTLARSVTQASVPPGSARFILGVIGGVGGSLTLLAYGYWMRERNWQGERWKNIVRFDLAVSYFLTGLFAVAVMILAAAILHADRVAISGSSGIIQMAAILAGVIGEVGHWAFLIGFWGAVFSSLLGVWQGVPYMFCDFVGLMKGLPSQQHALLVNTTSIWYRGYLLYLAVPPLLLLLVDRPIGVIVLYTIIGALFMPFLAGTLLYMNSRRDWVREEFRNGKITIAILVLTLILFLYLAIDEIRSALS